MIKFPFDRVMDMLKKTIRENSNATDAVIILIDQRTGDFKASTLRGDLDRLYHLIDRTKQALEKQLGAGKKKPTGIWMP